MKLTILQQDLLPALQAVSRSVGVRSTLPVLSNVLLQTENGKLKLSATNLEVGIIKRVNADIQKEGAITVPSRTFLDIISSLSGAKIDIDALENQLKITTKNFSGSLNGISASEFPAIPLATEQTVLISSKVLAQSLPKITFAAAADEGRPILTGILTEIKKDTLELVATDGFRLAHKTVKLEAVKENGFRALIPRRTFEEVVRLIGEDLDSKDEEKIEVSTSENQNQMIFKIGQTQLSSRLIEGQFPSWEKIVPTSHENRTIIDRVELLKAVKLASVFAKDASNVIKIETGESKLVLTSEAKELGGQKTDIEAEVSGSPIIIAFNSKYLIDALSATNATQITIEFSGNLSSALIKPMGEEGLEYIVMPIRLS